MSESSCIERIVLRKTPHEFIRKNNEQSESDGAAAGEKLHAEVSFVNYVIDYVRSSQSHCVAFWHPAKNDILVSEIISMNVNIYTVSQYERCV